MRKHFLSTGRGARAARAQYLLVAKSRATPKEAIQRFRREPNIDESRRRAETRRSDSGAAVRLTRGGELGCALGCARSSGGKTGYGFPAAPGRAWG